MADKQVKVKLVADVQNYVKGMRDAADATEGVERSAGNVKDWGGEWGAAASLVGGQMLAMGAATAVGIGLAVNSYANFDQAMSGVAAATHASAADMELLTAAARDAGKTTAFSATEAASAIEALSKAGVSTRDILGGGLKGALDLAAAGSLDVGQAAEIAATAMTQFKLSSDQLPHVADLLAAGAGKAQGEVSDLGQALQQGGLVASQFGLSIEETVGGLSAFASAGMIGSDAGTSFKTMIQRLSNPTGEASAKLKELGISAYDAQGNFVGLANFAGQLQTSMAGLTPEARNAAMAVIFGADAVRGASVLYEQGQAGIQGWIDKVNDAGFAAETAALKQDNLKGDLEKLGGAWDDLLIGMGAAADGPMRGVVQAITGMIDGFSGLNPVVQAVALGVAALAAGALLLGGAALTIIPRIAETAAALTTMGFSASAAKGYLSQLFSLKNIGWLAALSAAGAAVDVFVQGLKDGKASADELDNVLKTTGSGVQALNLAVQNTGTASVVWGDLTDRAKNLGATLDKISTGNFFDWMSNTASDWEFANRLQDVGKKIADLADSDLPKAQNAFKELANKQNLSADQQWKMLESMDAYKDKLTQVATEQGVNLAGMSEQERQATLVAMAMGDAGNASGKMAEGLSAQEQAAKSAAQATEDLIDSIRGLDDAMSAFTDSENGYYQALDDVNAALAENGATMDVTTKAGRDNRAALSELASATTDYAAEMLSMGQATGDVNAQIQAGRDQFIAAAEQMGMTGEAAVALADQYGLIPGNVQTLVTDSGTLDITAIGIDGVQQRIDALPPNTPVVVQGVTEEAKAKLENIGYTVRTLPDGTVTVTGRDNASWVANSVTSAINSIPSTKTVTIIANTVGNALGSFLSGNANGGMHAYVNGGYGSRSFPFGSLPTGIYPGGAPIYKFAEPETKWEAFISGRPGQEQRNIGIALDALRRLGYERAFADGSMVDYSALSSQQGSVSYHRKTVTQGLMPGDSLTLSIDGRAFSAVVGQAAAGAASSAVRSYDSDRSRTARHGRERGR